MKLTKKTKKRLRITAICGTLLTIILPLCAALVPQEQPEQKVDEETLRKFVEEYKKRTEEEKEMKNNLANVIRINDSINIVVSYKGKEETVKLIGISEPAEDAAKYLAAVTKDTPLSLELDTVERDKEGRLLAYAFLPDKTMLNHDLLNNGLAKLKAEKENTKYAVELEAAQTAAKENKAGIWAADEKKEAVK